MASLLALSVGLMPPRSPAAGADATLPILFNGSGVEAINPDGSNRHVVIADGSQADQTADGSRIVYVKRSEVRDSAGNLHDTLALYVAKGDGSGQAPIGSRDVYGYAPRWSPDGARVAFNVAPPDVTGDFYSQPQQIAIVNADGTDETVLGSGKGADWAPDGVHLAFEDDNRLWVTEAQPGSVPTPLTPALGNAAFSSASPSWSPDGTVIALVRQGCIAEVHPDGSGLRELDGTCNSGDTGFPEVNGWSPDSRQLLVTRYGFHQLAQVSWTDPDTGEGHGVSNATGSSWANPSGPVPCPRGYWLLGRDGGVFTFGDAKFYGSTGGMRLAQPVVGMASASSGNGYWLVAGDGGVFTFGDARFFGSTGALRLAKPVVGMAATPSGRGYWLVAADGGVFTFGDARFFGSTGSLRLAQPVVGMAATASGNGYWLVARDGGVFTFGDARFFGSTGGMRLAQPIVGMAATPSGNGYWLVGADGGVFTFGDASYFGSATIPGLGSPVVGLAGMSNGTMLAAGDGQVVALGDARFCGSARALHLAAPIVGLAAKG